MQRSDVPDYPHYAIVIINTKSVTIPGVERSRTNPGHGYSEHTETHDLIQYIAFSEGQKEMWEEKVKTLYKLEQEKKGHYSGTVVAFHVDKVAKPRLEVTID